MPDPPHGMGVPPKTPMPEWVSEFDAAKRKKRSSSDSAFVGPVEGFSQCVQEAGDIVFVPSGWHHAVMNLQPSVGIAIELGENRLLYNSMLGSPLPRDQTANEFSSKDDS